VRRLSIWGALASILALSLPPTAANGEAQMGEAREAAPFGAPVDDQHVWFHAVLDQFEGRFDGTNSLRWDGEVWSGTDTNRFWLKSEGQVEDDKLRDGQHELLYDRPLSTYFDLQGGLRYDLDDRPGRGWAAFGLEGLAPYFFHVSATGYASDGAHFAAKLTGSYDLLVTQRLILQPEMELNLHSKADPQRLVGSGVSNLDAGLRLRYEISRKFAPYIGVAYEKNFGRTESLAASAGEKTDPLRFLVGVRSWF
jgi:copper resistance protein B